MLKFNQDATGRLTTLTFGDAHILYAHNPSLQVGEEIKNRGGAHVCFPRWGDDDDEIDGSALRPHGLARISKLGKVQDVQSGQLSEVPHAGNVFYAWSYSLAVTTCQTGNGLTRTFDVTCQQDPIGAGMPVAPGDHPYFATYGSDFEILIGDTKIRQNQIIEGKTTVIVGQRARLTVNGRIVMITNMAGFDRFAIWTDYVQKYICVEPITDPSIYGASASRLEVGEGRTFTYRMSVMHTP